MLEVRPQLRHQGQTAPWHAGVPQAIVKPIQAAVLRVSTRTPAFLLSAPEKVPQLRRQNGRHHGMLGRFKQGAITESRPTSSLQDVSQNTRFLAVSAGGVHATAPSEYGRHHGMLGLLRHSGRTEPGRPAVRMLIRTPAFLPSMSPVRLPQLAPSKRTAPWHAGASQTDNRTNPEQQSSGCQPEHPLSCRQCWGRLTTAPSKRTAPWHAGATQSITDTSPTSSPQGVDQNTRFLAVSTGES